MRLKLDSYMIMLCMAAASRSTCARRQVGSIITNRSGLILSTGYNGVPHDFEHCIDSPCPGSDMPSGTGLDKCKAIHAEANAIIHCRDLNDADVLYCTDSPCIHCIKLVLATPIRKIVYLREYPHKEAIDLWREGDGEITRIEDTAQLRAIAHVSATITVEATRVATELVEREDSVYRHGDKGPELNGNGPRIPTG